MILVANPYILYILQVCVTYSDGHVSCSNKLVRSYKFPIFLSGVVSVIIATGGIVAYTIVIIVLSSRKKGRLSTISDVTNNKESLINDI